MIGALSTFSRSCGARAPLKPPLTEALFEDLNTMQGQWILYIIAGAKQKWTIALKNSFKVCVIFKFLLLTARESRQTFGCAISTRKY